MSQPIQVTTLLKLRENGIQQTNIGFLNTTLQSDKYVCVREVVGDQQRIAIVDISNPHNISRHSIKADSALMNPIKKTIALKADNTLQIFDLEAKAKVAAHTTTDSVKFWKWVTPELIVFVSENKVFHWETNGNSPKMMFLLSPAMQSALLLNYHMDHTMTWHALVGVNSANNKITGIIQLAKPSSGADSQMIEASAMTFSRLVVGNDTEPTSFFIFVNKNESVNKVAIIDLNQKQPKRYIDLGLQPNDGDFPLAIHSDNTSGLFYVITKKGLLHMCEIESSKRIFASKISDASVFTSVNSTDFSFLVLNSDGVLTRISMDKNNVANYCKMIATQNIANHDIGAVGMKLIERCALPGSEEVYQQKFNMMIVQQQYDAAAKFAATSPNNVLRTPQNVAKLQSVPTTPGQPSPLLQYFGVLLESGKLTEFESIELCKPVVAQGKVNLVEKWLNENKLECSGELGDIIKKLDPKLAQTIYARGNAHERVMQTFAETGQFDKIVVYAQKVGSTPNYVNILGEIVKVNPDASVNFAKQLLNENPPLIDIDNTINVYMSFNMAQHCTNALLDTLKQNKPEYGGYQSRILEMDVLQCPQIADAILGNRLFTHYDRPHIAQLCERAGLIQRALENYEDIYDIKRCIIHTRLLNQNWIMEYFGTLSMQDSMECIRVLLESNPVENTNLCVKVALKYHEQLTSTALINIFESTEQLNGLFLFLGGIVNFSQDPEVHFKYIQVACKIGQIGEAERICKESNFYDAEKVKNFLKSLDLDDPRPLIIVCDRNNLIDELIQYLYKNQRYVNYLKIYVQKVNPTRLPSVAASLLDSGCEQDFIKEMISNTPDSYDMVELVKELKKRNSMKLLMPVLEQRIMNGSTDVATHTAMAIIRVDNGTKPQKFLLEDQYYDFEKVGKYCEKIDATLSVIAYTRGECNQQLIDICYKTKLFRQLGEYLVKKKDENLWNQVLDDKNEHRRSVIDQLVQTVLPATTDSDEVGTTVKAFMRADIPHELTSLLYRLISGNSLFSSHRNLQNLLILTAIKAERERVMDYVTKLDNYDAPDIANVAKKNGLFEESFIVYKKHNIPLSAMDVLVRHLKDMTRAYEYAEKVNLPEVWSLFARAQLMEGLVKESIISYIKAKDVSNYKEIIAAAKNVEEYVKLKIYMEMAITEYNDGYVHNNYAYCLIRLNQLEEMEKFIKESDHVSLVEVGDICFNEKYYEAAKLLYGQASNYPKIAVVDVKLKDYFNAVECAKKANNLKTWKEVCTALLDDEQFKLAQICGLNLVVTPEELSEITEYYQNKGFFNELITLLEAGVGLDRANRSIYTELAVVYAKYKPEKLKEHLDLFWSKLNISSVLLVAEEFHMWAEVVYLYEKYKEYDNALRTIIDHSVASYQESLLRDIAQKTVNVELLYRTVDFYMEQHPLLVSEFLITVSSKLDPQRVIDRFKLSGHISMIKPYLEHVQRNDTRIVNETLNQLYVDEFDFKGLAESVEKYSNFEMVALAEKLEHHELIEFRRIANVIYTVCNRWNKSIELAKKDGLENDAAKYASQSRDPVFVESLLKEFTSKKLGEPLVQLTYLCYDLLGPDDVLEHCWRNNMLEFCIPYFVQLLHEVVPLLQGVSQKLDEKPKKTIKEKTPIMVNNNLLITSGQYQPRYNSPGGPNPSPFGGPNNF